MNEEEEWDTLLIPGAIPLFSGRHYIIPLDYPIDDIQSITMEFSDGAKVEMDAGNYHLMDPRNLVLHGNPFYDIMQLVVKCRLLTD